MSESVVKSFDLIDNQPSEAVDKSPNSSPKHQNSVLSMDDYFIKHYKQYVVRHLNEMLDSGELSQVVGQAVVSKEITDGDCCFKRFHYYRINRTDMWITIELRLMLDFENERSSVLLRPLLWFTFGDDVDEEAAETCADSTCCTEEVCEIEEIRLLSADMDDSFLKECLDLDKYLIPYMKMAEIDSNSAQLLSLYCSVSDAMPLSARELVKRLGLSIVYVPLYQRSNIASILFFDDGVVMERKAPASGQRVQPLPVQRRIKKHTIVLNANARVDRESLHIFHECIHYEWHYLFYKLQDKKRSRMKSYIVSPEESDEQTDSRKAKYRFG